MVRFNIPNREVFKEAVFNKVTVGKIDFELLKSKLPFDIDFLKGNHHLSGSLKNRLVNEESVKLFKNTIGELKKHYCLAVEGSDNYTYVAVFTKSLKNWDPVMLKYKFIPKIITQGQENIGGHADSIQYLIVDPIYQFNSDWIKFSPFRLDNVKGANYYTMHGQELDWAFYSAYKNPLNGCLSVNEIISDVHGVVLKISELSNIS